MRAAVTALVLALASARWASAQMPAATTPQPARQRISPPWRMSVRADNDAFNFWQGITDRPDEEYTNGDEVTVEFSGAPWWGKRLARRRAPCTGLEASGVHCLTTSLSIAQDMYTPRPHHEPREVPNWRDERPYAALLYGNAEARVVGEGSLETIGLLVGLTGPAAMGEFAQRTAHKLSGVYSRDPVGWDTQVGAEPLLMVTGRTTRRFAARTSSGAAVLDFMPHAGVSLGNVLTEAEAGFQTRVGMNLSSPWWTSGWGSRAAVEMYLLGGLRGEAVAHNLTLDGNTLGADRRVDRTPLVGEYLLGVGARYRGFVAEWRAVTRSREYRTGPLAHAYSTLYASYEVPVHGRR